MDFLNDEKTRRAVQLSGYDLDKVSDCNKIETPWFSHATVLSFRRVSPQLDDYPSFTLVSLPNKLWVIPVSQGMLEYRHLEDGARNRSIFNFVLRSSPVRPSSDRQWISLAQSYIALFGHLKNESATTTRISEQFPDQVTCANSRCTVRLLEPNPSGDSGFIYTLTFLVGDSGVSLEQAHSKPATAGQ